MDTCESDIRNYRSSFFFICVGIWTLILCASLLSLAKPVQAQETAPKPYSDKINIPIAFQIYLPLARLDIPFRTGSALLQNGPTVCDIPTNQFCYLLEITCPDLAQNALATLKVGNSLAQTDKGTIIFFSGYTGESFWEGRSMEAQRIIQELRTAGFRTVQLQWANNWWNGAKKMSEGHARLACRPATVTRWVFDNLHSMDTAFCAEGWSDGASALSYTLVQYNLSGLLSSVIFESGPNWTRLDHGCIQDDPAYSSLFYGRNHRKTIDMAFGYPENPQPGEGGPCFNMDASFRGEFMQASILNDRYTYSFPHTHISFMFGDQDQTLTKAHGYYFYTALTQAGTPKLYYTEVSGSSHDIVLLPSGADALRDELINHCKLH